MAKADEKKNGPRREDQKAGPAKRERQDRIDESQVHSGPDRDFVYYDE